MSKLHSSLFSILWLSCLLALVIAESEPSPTALTKPKPRFDFDTLKQYSNLVQCFAKISDEFVNCNDKAEEMGRKYLEGVDPDSEWAKRIRCCGLWRIRDCWAKYAYERCTRSQAQQIHLLPYTMMGDHIEAECKDYPPGSDLCKFPWWLILIVVLVFGLILGLSIWLTVRCIRSRRQKRRQQHNDEKDPASKPLSA